MEYIPITVLIVTIGIVIVVKSILAHRCGCEPADPIDTAMRDTARSGKCPVCGAHLDK